MGIHKNIADVNEKVVLLNHKRVIMLLVKIEGDVYLTFTEFHSEIWIPKKPFSYQLLDFGARQTML